MDNQLERIDSKNMKPRSYQDQLLDVVLKKNSIIYLPTGAGKTYIAVMAIHRMAKDLEGSIRDGGKRTVFLVNTVALARQQAQAINSLTDFKVAVYVGDMNVDNWKKEKWLDEFDKAHVIVATTQIVLDIIRHGYLAVTDFNIIIFDECHHARKEHPMHQLMSQFRNHPEHLLPRVIGLTGVLILSSSKTQIFNDLDSLEKSFYSTIVTVSSIQDLQNVLVYSTKPEENIVSYTTQNYSLNVVDKIKNIISTCVGVINGWEIDKTTVKPTKNMDGMRVGNFVKKIKNLMLDFVYQLDDFGLYGASIAILAVLVELEIKKRGSDTIINRNLCRVCITYAERIRHIIMQQFDEDDEEIADEILTNSTPRLQTFLLYIKQTFQEKCFNDIKCLIFVKRRHTAKCLYHILKRFVTSCDIKIPIVPEFMVGTNNQLPESIEAILDEKWNKDVLNRFKRNECNVIVASSVLEEGIDVQSCNYVIAYDKIETFRSYAQTKGRARKVKSTYAMFVSANDKADFIKKIINFREIDGLLKEYLIGKSIDRQTPLIEDSEKQFENPIEPFYTPFGAVLEGASAVQLLNRYCMSLPNDSYTFTMPIWTKVPDKDGKVIIKLTLPLQCTIKEDIYNDPDISDGIKWAKRSAAFNACKQLYFNKELNENLLPISKEKCLGIITPVYFKHWENFPNDKDNSAGTKKNKRSHPIQYPNELIGAMPKSGHNCYLYKLELTPTFSRNVDNGHIYDLLLTETSYGILTMKELPKLAEMPLFLTQGEVIAKITYTPTIVRIDNDNDLLYLRNFHVMIFRDILHIWKDFFAYDYRNEQNSILITPIDINGKTIDWNLVRNFQNLLQVHEPSEVQRQRLEFNPEDYLNRIVSTWYSVDEDIRYVVHKVRTDLTPISPFPNQQFENYAAYIYEKYKVSVIQANQFLLEVKPITTRLNLLHHGVGEDGGKKKLKRLDDILLIPELCHNFKYPGDMWLKAKFIPSILHRLHYLLLAENIRISINSHLGIEIRDYTPTKLIIDRSLRRVEKMNPQQLVRSTVIPDPNDTEAKELRNIVTLSEASQFGWKEYEEPCDLTRYLDKMYKIELDYYHQFITKRPVKNLADISVDSLYNSLPALCDIPDNEKYKIKILSLDQEILNNGAEQWEYLCAITASSSSDVFDMEKLEVLGDSFLKFSISLILLRKHPTWNEGFLTAVKGRFVSNRNLLYCSIARNLPGILKTISFNPKNDWQPPLLSIPKSIKDVIVHNCASPNVLWKLKLDNEEIRTGECKTETIRNFIEQFTNEDPDQESAMQIFLGQQRISDKACADCMEALLGVCLRNYGIKRTFSILQFLGITPSNDNLIDLLNINLGSPRLRTNITDTEIDAFLFNYKELEKKLDYTFKDRGYLLQALTHPSFPTNRLTGCYQQLEFIGDAILDFLITSYICEKCDDMGPGKLTDLRSALVNNVTLGCLSVRNKFHVYMLQQNSVLTQSIRKFVQFQETQHYKVTDQVRVLIQETESDVGAMADYIEVPKALGDIFESLIGAVYLDSGNDLETTWKVIYRLMSQEIQQFMRDVPIQVVRRLHEYHGAGPVYSEATVVDDVVMVKCRFTCKNKIVEVTGFGRNKEYAKISAAKIALQTLAQA